MLVAENDTPSSTLSIFATTKIKYESCDKNLWNFIKILSFTPCSGHKSFLEGDYIGLKQQPIAMDFIKDLNIDKVRNLAEDA